MGWCDKLLGSTPQQALTWGKHQVASPSVCCSLSVLFYTARMKHRNPEKAIAEVVLRDSKLNILYD